MPKISGIDKLQEERVINWAINGRVDLWQRGSSLSVAPSTTKYLADRFGLGNGQSVNVSYTRISSVPSLSQPLNYAMRWQPVSTDTVAAGNFLATQYSLEGPDLRRFFDRDLHVYFYARSNLTGTWAVVARSTAANRGYPATFTTDVANTWELKHVIIPFKDVVGGTFSSAEGTAGCYLWWALTAGTTFQFPANQWSSANVAGVAGMPNFMGSTSNTFDLTGVVFADQPLSTVDYLKILNAVPQSEELTRCKRYCQKSYDPGVDPGTNANEGAEYVCTGANDNQIANNTIYKNIRFSPEMAAPVPTVIVYDRIGSGTSRVSNNSGTTLGANTGVPQIISSTGFNVVNNAGPIATNNFDVVFHWIASGEL